MNDTSDDCLIEIIGPEDIPQFANEDEEDQFWSTHCLGPTYFARVDRIPTDSPLLPPIDRSRRHEAVHRES